jgi:hypothetical protein
MNPVSSTNSAGMTDLIQLLSSSSSPLVSSGLSSSQIQSALQKASPDDIVQLSDQAMQLQEFDTMFGSSDTSQTTSLFSTPSASSSNDTFNNLIAALNSASSSTTSSAISSGSQSTSSSSLASDMANYQSQLQVEGMQALFGMNSTQGTSGTLLDTLA